MHIEQLSEEELRRLKKERKGAKTYTLILVTLVINYIPAVVLF